ncbi:hypothetical protein HMPREF0872_04085 [Veillonella montpellierensis DNF00314]|uniref:Tyr recombinase domain-containing protein n=1 Tax=Veillonella montpellierensis DNF00314 TaxID=1401067 RepID=A0A096BXW0_9FIRM|nr:site-specific integrase [Veillonella montpellierensis]KGF47577.1 hypothetical protein HMPREF0872_04085 [Veillonella montpellierensis DNF00314]
MGVKKRGNQDGTFYQRKNGTWCGQVMIDNKRYTVYGKGIQECRQKLRDKIKEKKTSTSTTNFYDYCISSINEQLNNGVIKKSTYIHRIEIIGKHRTHLVKIPISSITAKDIQNIVNDCKDYGNKPSTIKHVVAIFLTICRKLYEDGIINKEIKRKELSIGSIENKKIEVESFEFALNGIEKIENPMAKMAVNIMLHSGLRVGEVLGLKWEDIDIKKCQLKVNRTIVRLVGIGVEEQTPKSKRIGEIVQLPTSFMDILLDYKKSSKGDYLFKTNGQFLAAETVRKNIKKVFKGTHLEKGCHQFRHLYASHLLKNNINLKTIQLQLRHVNIATTEKYLHELKGDIRNDIAELNF